MVKKANCRAVKNDETVEDLAVKLAGICLAPTLPPKGKKRELWFRGWFKQLRREILARQ
jgi:hypothetical protein